MPIPHVPLGDLVNLRQKWPAMAKMGGMHAASQPGRLTEVASFGDNPGQLRMLAYVPDRLPRSSPLVVALHGCTQNASGYDRGSGWSELADQHAFAVLAPEQTKANNANTCFDWFMPEDTTRGHGEVASIAAMVRHMVEAYGLDRRRVFITGLSAGGAMTAAMLATYPELFAGGAIIAGLPYGSANGLKEALPAMFTPQPHAAAAWGGKVRAASRYAGPWAPVSIWHGDADRTVAPGNADESVKQWLDVHGLAQAAPVTDLVDGVPHQSWRDRSGRVMVESYRLAGFGHGTPIDPAAAEGGVGAAAAHILASPISSTWRIAKSWGLTGRTRVQPVPRAPHADPAPLSPMAIIDKALRVAGLR